MRPFDEAETSLVRALVDRPNRLAQEQEHALRWALNLARLWILETEDGPLVVGPKLAAFRERLRPLALDLARGRISDPGRLAGEAIRIRREADAATQRLLVELHGRLGPEDLERELRRKALVLVLGGGGGCGYLHLGVFALLEELGLRPDLIVGASMGSVLGLFRAREQSFREDQLRSVTYQLSYRRMFRLLDTRTRYAMPGALRLHLRGTLAPLFVGDTGETMRIAELKIPFVSVVTGLHRESMRDVQRYERMFLAQLRKGAFARLLHVKDLIQNVSALFQELYSTPGALTEVPLGHDDRTLDFDVIDAVGFSAAVPAILQYDITREDQRMHDLMRSTLDYYGVDVFADGGLVANVPARTAWEHIQLGRLKQRNSFILGLDCFAPQLARNVLFVPLQRVAAQNVARNEPFAQLLIRYRRVPPPTALVLKPQGVTSAFEHGRGELGPYKAFLKKIMAPLPKPTAMVSD